MLTAPDHLDELARAEFGRLAPTLPEADAATGHLLAAYCVVWSRWCAAERALAELGPIIKGQSGAPCQNPNLNVADKCIRQLQSLSKALGISSPAKKQQTPAAPAKPTRARPAPQADERDDEIESKLLQLSRHQRKA